MGVFCEFNPKFCPCRCNAVYKIIQQKCYIGPRYKRTRLYIEEFCHAKFCQQSILQN